jgi:hypothetical protein
MVLLTTGFAGTRIAAGRILRIHATEKNRENNFEHLNESQSVQPKQP